MNTITEVLTGIVSRVTYHNPATAWSVLSVQPFQSPQQQETVTVHQTKVFAGATMEFRGAWTLDQQYGRQFKDTEAIEKKPATTASIEKYLGSGLIKGVGPNAVKLSRSLSGAEAILLASARSASGLSCREALNLTALGWAQCLLVKPFAERSRSDFTGFGSAQPAVYLAGRRLT